MVEFIQVPSIKLSKRERLVKTRKQHLCCVCENLIDRGEMAVLGRFREAKCDASDKQIGIEYIRYYAHSRICQGDD